MVALSSTSQPFVFHSLVPKPSTPSSESSQMDGNAASLEFGAPSGLRSGSAGKLPLFTMTKSPSGTGLLGGGASRRPQAIPPTSTSTSTSDLPSTPTPKVFVFTPLTNEVRPQEEEEHVGLGAGAGAAGEGGGKKEGEGEGETALELITKGLSDSLSLSLESSATPELEGSTTALPSTATATPTKNVFAPSPSPPESKFTMTKYDGLMSVEEQRLKGYKNGVAPKIPPASKTSSFSFSSPSKYSNNIAPAVPASPFSFSATSTPVATTSKPPSTSISSPSPFSQTQTPNPPTPIFQTQPRPRPLASPVPPISFGSSPSGKPLSARRMLGMMDLLGDDEDVEGTCGRHETVTAPIFSHDALETFSEESQKMDFPQYGLFGRLLETHSKTHSKKPESPFLYLNSNTPLSAVICGVQGSGKSHSVSLLLETMFIKDKRLGRLKNPVAGVVFHFGEGGAASQPCEAAWIASSSDQTIGLPRVVVYVSPSSFVTMKAVYSQIPNVSVYPLYLSEKELNSKSMLAMLGVGNGEPPLYISIIKNILQGLGEDFSYSKFLSQLEIRKASFNPAQLAGLEQRMALLESFLDGRAERKGHACEQARVTARQLPKFAKGQLTILDLSDPFIDASQACSLFEISLGQFIRAKVNGAGKVCLLDEAHKYLDGSEGSTGSSRLTESLLSVVRQQRHLGLRVILATQEPTVVAPALLALTSIIVLHRFSSLAWWKHLTHHLGSELDNEAFDKVVTLKTGTSLIICPSALGRLADLPVASNGAGGISTPASDDLAQAPFVFGAGEEEKKEPGRVGQLGRGWMLVKGRKRLTVDGGKSVLAV